MNVFQYLQTHVRDAHQIPSYPQLILLTWLYMFPRCYMAAPGSSRLATFASWR